MYLTWRSEQIKKKKTQKLERYLMYHPRGDLGRLQVKKKDGGRGLLQI